MNRREAIAAALLGPALPRLEVTPVKRERPWSELAKELEAIEGQYCDFVAWDKWMRGQLESFYPAESCWAPAEVFDDIMIAEKVPMYCLMCQLADRGEA